jgi:hypothetical protein
LTVVRSGYYLDFVQLPFISVLLSTSIIISTIIMVKRSSLFGLHATAALLLLMLSSQSLFAQNSQTYHANSILLDGGSGNTIFLPAPVSGGAQIFGWPVGAGIIATQGYVTTQLGNYLPLAGGTMAGNITMGGHTISGATITGGSINSTPVGATTASTGAFTTLGATTSETFSNLTLGSIPFVGAAGLVSQDNANFFWDATNKRLAVGSGTAPSTTLEVSNSIASAPVARFYSGSGAAFSSAGYNAGGLALYSAAIGGVGSVSTIAALPVSAGNYPSALSFQTALTGPATTLERLNISPSGVIKMTTYSTNGVAHFTAGNGTVTSSQIANADIAAGAVDLASQVTGVLPVANGGTGSNSQNFVDLTTAQSVGGNKTFTGSVKVNGTLSNTAANIFDAGAPTGENTGSFIWQQASGGGYAAAIDNAGAAANSNALIVETSAIGASNRILDVNSGGADRFIVFGDGSISAPGAFTGGAGSFPSLSVTTGASGFVLGSGANATTLTSTATAARAISFPDAAGTLALLSDIPGSFTGTPNTIAKFTGTNTIGNSALTDNGTTLGYNFFSLSSGQISALGASFANTSSNGRIVGITNNDASGGGGNSRALDITMPNSPVATGTATGIKFSVAGPGAGTSYDMLGTGSTWNVNTAGLGSFNQVKIGGGTPIISVIKAGVDLSGTVITGSTSTEVTISGGGFGTMNYGDAVMVEFSNNSVIGTAGTPTFISWSAGVSDPATFSITINFRNGGSTVTLPAGTTCLATIIHM